MYSWVDWQSVLFYLGSAENHLLIKYHLVYVPENMLRAKQTNKQTNNPLSLPVRERWVKIPRTEAEGAMQAQKKSISTYKWWNVMRKKKIKIPRLCIISWKDFNILFIWLCIFYATVHLNRNVLFHIIKKSEYCNWTQNHWFLWLLKELQKYSIKWKKHFWILTSIVNDLGFVLLVCLIYIMSTWFVLI